MYVVMCGCIDVVERRGGGCKRRLTKEESAPGTKRPALEEEGGEKTEGEEEDELEEKGEKESRSEPLATIAVEKVRHSGLCPEQQLVCVHFSIYMFTCVSRTLRRQVYRKRVLLTLQRSV